MNLTHKNSHVVRWRLSTVVATLWLAITAAANAQSGVTIYGILDSGVEAVTNVGASKATVKRVPTLTGGMYPSRLGFRGREDLGDGLSANFVLEQGLAVDQGTLN